MESSSDASVASSPSVEQRHPDFIIGGAPKCGTTSLAFTLMHHPGVFIPAVKELSYFHCDNWQRGNGWFSDQFAQARPGQKTGEATPDYLASELAAERIAQTQPEVKLVFLLRDPVLRAHSHYWFRFRSMREQRGMGEVLDAELGGEDGYLLSHGTYAYNLERYLARFPASNIHVAFLEELSSAPERELQRVQEFLGITTTLSELSRDNQASVSRSRLILGGVRRFIEHDSIVKDAYRHLLPKRIRKEALRIVTRFNSRAEKTPALEPEHEARLREYFAPHDAELRTLLDRPALPWDREH